MQNKRLWLWLILVITLLLGGCADLTQDNPQDQTPLPEVPIKIVVTEDGHYNSKDEVALYIFTYQKLPGNYLTKSEAEDLGWVSSKGNLDEVAPGMSIGGNRLGNYEGLLPDAKNRIWTECDINYEGGFRGAERIVFSNDGLIYYTADHYETFEKIEVEGP
jgi:hypothetical protein